MRQATEDPQDQTRAQINLAKVKASKAEQKKIYKLRVNHNTVIMVSKKNFNKAYADAYADRIANSQPSRKTGA